MKLASLLLYGTLVSGTIVGCEAPGPTATAGSQNAARQRFFGQPSADVFAAAEEAVAEHFRIERSDPAAGIIVAEPKEGPDAEAGATLRKVRGAEERVRRAAEVRVENAGSSAVVYCRVAVQRLETSQRQTFARDYAARDIPNETPVDREGATTPEQNAVWSTTRRDRALESAILRAIDEKLAQLPTTTP